MTDPNKLKSDLGALYHTANPFSDATTSWISLRVGGTEARSPSVPISG